MKDHIINKSDLDEEKSLKPQARPLIDPDNGKDSSCWNPSFMDADPMATLGLREGPSAPGAPPSVKIHDAEKPPHLPSNTVTAITKDLPEVSNGASSIVPPSRFGPAFLSYGNHKTYSPTGEGLRDAIKENDAEGVKQLLAINPKICNYQDRLSQTMLHLAALFDNTEIAILLLNAGADPLATNHDKETPIDIAMPVLQEKMKQYQCRRSLSTVVKNDED